MINCMIKLLCALNSGVCIMRVSEFVFRDSLFHTLKFVLLGSDVVLQRGDEVFLGV